MTAEAPMWIQILVAVLLVFSGLLALTGALGLVRFKDFFQRMHPPALGATLGTWCACGASLAYFAGIGSGFLLHIWLIPIFLSITVPITTVMLARAALFRKREIGANVPPPLSRGSGLRPSVHDKGKIIPDPGDDLP